MKTFTLLALMGAALLFTSSPVHAEAGTFKISSLTEIQLDDVNAAASDLKVGMRAFVTPDPMQEGYAISIEAQSGKPATNAEKVKKVKPKLQKAATITAVSDTSITIDYK